MKLKAILAVALIVWAGYSLLPAAERARFTRAGDDRTSIQRLDYWKAGVKMIEKHPIFGVGYFNFPSYFAAHYPHELWDGYAQLPHNIFIQVGTDTGLLGLGIFLMLIYGNLKAAKDIQRLCENHEQAPRFASSVARGLATAVWGFVIAGQFDTVTYYPFFWINLALTISLANIVTRSVEQKAAQAQAAPFGRSVRGRQSRASPAQRHQAAPR